MKVVIAEKPSVAREIARLLNADIREDGYLSGNGYYVTWAYGHLISLGMPEDYGISGFNKASLPILPDPFVLTVRHSRTKGSNYAPDKGALKQLKIIQQLFAKCSSIIVATDAGREGELIFRYIYEYLNCTKPFQRLWISSLTEKAIKNGFDNLKDGHEFDGLYNAAKSRSRADWLVGINASQALSIAAGNGIYSLGRVQSPTLALICKRYLDHKNFSVQHYWQIELLHIKEFIEFKSCSTTKWLDKKQAEDALKSIGRTGTVSITSVSTKTIEEQPPLLFDLTGLQKEANKKFNLSAEETLQIAQSLYENKFITYPRTGSKYIPADLWAEIPALVRALENYDKCKKVLSKMKWGRFNKRIVNDLRVTDHHGLLTTDKIPSALSSKENAIYDLIAFRLLESLSTDCIKEITAVQMEVLHHDFIAKGCKVIEPGWRGIKNIFLDDTTEVFQELPPLEEGAAIKIKEATILNKQTKPPALLTEAGLLSAMENAGKEIDSPDQRKALQNIGIGTPATRAAIIETLLNRSYIYRDKKTLVPTDKGLQVYDLVKDHKIANVLMTAEWEMAFQSIENNEMNSVVFHNQMQEYTRSVTAELLQSSIAQKNVPDLICPKCKEQPLLIRDKLVKCPDESCSWIQFRNVCGVYISISEIQNLLQKGKTSLIRGMTSSGGKKFNAYITMSEEFKSKFEFKNS